MGLLDKAADRKDSNNPAGNVTDVIAGFSREHPLFHCVVLHFGENREEEYSDIAGLVGDYGAVYRALTGGNCLVMLPGRLDSELFSHRLSNSTNSTVLFQFSAKTSSLALEQLGPYL
jgi:hypothetical protein